MRALGTISLLVPLVLLLGCSPEETDVTPWLDTLPASVRTELLWEGDTEEGALTDWGAEPAAGPGTWIQTSEGAEVRAAAAPEPVRSGSWSLAAGITGAYRGENGTRTALLSRSAYGPDDQTATAFPTSAYYSTWVYFPRTYNPNKYASWSEGDEGWQIMRFESEDSSGRREPLWDINVTYDDDSSLMYFYLRSEANPPGRYAALRFVPIRVGRWTHLEFHYVQSTEASGSIQVWQDGVLIFDLSGVVTLLEGPLVWSLGSSTEHVTGLPNDGTATLYFDDAAVSTVPLHSYR